MSDAERLALIEKGLLTDHCIHNFDAGWLLSRVKLLEREVSYYRGMSQRLESGDREL